MQACGPWRSAYVCAQRRTSATRSSPLLFSHRRLLSAQLLTPGHASLFLHNMTEANVGAAARGHKGHNDSFSALRQVCAKVQAQLSRPSGRASAAWRSQWGHTGGARARGPDASTALEDGHARTRGSNKGQISSRTREHDPVSLARRAPPDPGPQGQHATSTGPMRHPFAQTRESARTMIPSISRAAHCPAPLPRFLLTRRAARRSSACTGRHHWGT
jgi:hypothetical protein